MNKRRQLVLWLALDRVMQIQLGDPEAVKEVAAVLGWLHREIPMLREKMESAGQLLGTKVPKLPPRKN